MSPPSSESNALAGALGSMIGYLGAEAAEPSMFERLLWPQRFYHYNSLGGVIKSALCMPMGGPLHKAALETLDRFRRKGLYAGKQRGHMLGTAFYPSTGLHYKLHHYHGTDSDDEVRNGLWVSVMQRVSHYQEKKKPETSDPGDEEKQKSTIHRTTQKVQHLKLTVPDASPSDVKDFCEDSINFGALVTIVASEISAVACACIILLAEQRCYWFAAYLLLPLVLKFLSIFCSVRRDPALLNARAFDGDDILVEISDYDHGFPLISGPEEVVRQFFRHWGHPIRENGRDRTRELAGLGLVLCFVLCFPIGLLSMLWVSQTVQVVWLAYQMFIIVAMHLNRLVGFEGPGRLEDSIAAELVAKKVVRLRSKHGGVVEARLSLTSVSGIKEGRLQVEEIVKEHAASMQLLKRSDSDQSQASTLFGDLDPNHKSVVR